MASWQPTGLWGLLNQPSCQTWDDTLFGVQSQYLTRNITKLGH